MENNSSGSTVKTSRSFGFNTLNLLIALLSAFIIVVLSSASILIFRFNLHDIKVMAFSLLAFYALLMFFLALRRSVRKVDRTQTKIRFVDKIVEKPVIQRVVVHEPGKIRTRTITKIVNRVKTVQQKAKKLNIPQFKFIGSSVSKRFHTHACRLGKLIKRKFKVHHNSKSYFIKRRFKPCKVCILKTKKI